MVSLHNSQEALPALPSALNYTQAMVSVVPF